MFNVCAMSDQRQTAESKSFLPYLIAMKNFSLSSALFQNVVTLDGNFLFSWGGFGF